LTRSGKPFSRTAGDLAAVPGAGWLEDAAPNAKGSRHAAADGSLAFNTTSIEAKAGEVTVVMDNPSSSGIDHGIAISGNGVDQDGKVVQPGASSTIKVKLRPGTYVFFCPVPGHEEAGMKGTLTVR
jgi:uncharacterized cupredoxin-like copper-binding protein